VRVGLSVFSMTEQVSDWGLLAPTRMGGSPVLLHLTLPDPDDACARMVAHGGEVLIPIEDRFYGKREGRVRDPFGHLWILSRPLGDTREQ
jgi:PhnB protein